MGLKFGFAQPKRVTARRARRFLLACHRRQPLHDGYGFRLGYEARQSGNARLGPDEHLNPAGVTDDVGLALLAALDSQGNQAQGTRERGRGGSKRDHELTESCNLAAMSIASRILQLLTLGNECEINEI